MTFELASCQVAVGRLLMSLEEFVLDVWCVEVGNFQVGTISKAIERSRCGNDVP